ncbi:hypothetical protein BCEP27_60236 [Burkholderia cepacia]
MPAVHREDRPGRRPGRHSREQRGHHARHDAAQARQGQLGCGDPHEPRFRVQHDEAGLRKHGRARLGPHRQHLVGERLEGFCRPDQLRGREGRHARLHEIARARDRAQGRDGEHRVAGLPRDEDGHGDPAGHPRLEDPPADSGGPARQARGSRGAGRLPVLGGGRLRDGLQHRDQRRPAHALTHGGPGGAHARAGPCSAGFSAAAAQVCRCGPAFRRRHERHLDGTRDRRRGTGRRADDGDLALLARTAPCAAAAELRSSRLLARRLRHVFRARAGQAGTPHARRALTAAAWRQSRITVDVRSHIARMPQGDARDARRQSLFSLFSLFPPDSPEPFLWKIRFVVRLVASQPSRDACATPCPTAFAALAVAWPKLRAASPVLCAASFESRLMSCFTSDMSACAIGLISARTSAVPMN